MIDWGSSTCSSFKAWLPVLEPRTSKTETRLVQGQAWCQVCSLPLPSFSEGDSKHPDSPQLEHVSLKIPGLQMFAWGYRRWSHQLPPCQIAKQDTARVPVPATVLSSKGQFNCTSSPKRAIDWPHGQRLADCIVKAAMFEKVLQLRAGKLSPNVSLTPSRCTSVVSSSFSSSPSSSFFPLSSSLSPS